MKYFREYPFGMQILLFLLMAFTMWVATVFLFYLLTRLSGFTLDQVQNISASSPMALINTAVVAQGLGNAFMYLLPAALFAYLAHPKPMGYLGLRAPGKNLQFVLVILVMLGAMPVLTWIEELISHIDFGAKIKASQAQNDNMMKAFLRMPDAATFLRALLVMALVPALGEELLFRGVLLRMAKKRSAGMTIPIIFSAIIFSYAHTNIYGYLSIFLAGVLLAVVYYLTGSLWCSIVAHMFFNGTQIVLAYMSNSNPALKKLNESTAMPAYLVVAGAVLFGISFYLLLKNKTPLPRNWTDDFSGEKRTEFDFEEKME